MKDLGLEPAVIVEHTLWGRCFLRCLCTGCATLQNRMCTSTGTPSSETTKLVSSLHLHSLLHEVVSEFGFSVSSSAHHTNKTAKSTFEIRVRFLTGSAIWTISRKMTHLAAQQALSNVRLELTFIGPLDVWLDFEGKGRFGVRFASALTFPRPRDVDGDSFFPWCEPSF